MKEVIAYPASSTGRKSPAAALKKNLSAPWTCFRPSAGLIGIEKPANVHLDGSDLTPLLTRVGSFQEASTPFLDERLHHGNENG